MTSTRVETIKILNNFSWLNFLKIASLLLSSPSLSSIWRAPLKGAFLVVGFLSPSLDFCAYNSNLSHLSETTTLLDFFFAIIGPNESSLSSFVGSSLNDFWGIFEKEECFLGRPLCLCSGSSSAEAYSLKTFISSPHFWRELISFNKGFSLFSFSFFLNELMVYSSSVDAF